MLIKVIVIEETEKNKKERTEFDRIMCRYSFKFDPDANKMFLHKIIK